MNICKNCRHFLNMSEGISNWDMYCKHPQLQRSPSLNPVTGERGFLEKNDMGKVYFTTDPYPHASDINTGDCRLYERGYLSVVADTFAKTAPTR